MKSVVAIIGPTAIGKSELALALAEEFAGEIVSADSRQVYRYMDIGTAKPGPQQRLKINHHLIDLIYPDQDFSLALYQKMSFQAIEACLKRDHLPLLVGGSGLYVWSVLEGWKIPQVPPDHSLRRSLEQRAQNEGGLILHRELQVLDPEAARQIDWRIDGGQTGVSRTLFVGWHHPGSVCHPGTVLFDCNPGLTLQADQDYSPYRADL